MQVLERAPPRDGARAAGADTACRRCRTGGCGACSPWRCVLPGSSPCYQLRCGQRRSSRWREPQPARRGRSPRGRAAAAPPRPAMRGGAVAVRRVVGGHHGDRDAQPGVREQRRLVVDLARDAPAPAALEGDPPAARAPPRRCPSAAPGRLRAAAPSRTRGGAAGRAGRRAGRSAPGRPAVIVEPPQTGCGTKWRIPARRPSALRPAQADARVDRVGRAVVGEAGSSASSSARSLGRAARGRARPARRR